MKKYILVAALALLFFSACNNHSKSDSSKESTTESTSRSNAELPQNFSKRFEGEIAGKHVTMNLEKVDYSYSGSYYYDGSWLALSTDTLIGKDSIVLAETNVAGYEYDENYKPNTLSLKWTGNGFKGKWRSAKKDKVFDINLTEKYPEGSYAFSITRFEDSKIAFPKMKESPAAEIGFKALSATGNSEGDKWLNQELKKMMDLKPSEDWNAGFKRLTKAYFDDYLSGVKDLSSEDEISQASLNYSNHSTQTVLFNDKDFIVVEFMVDDYSGGAHGNYASLMHCLDVKNKKQLKLDDVVRIDSNALQALLEKNLRKQYNVKAGDQLTTVLFDNYLKANDNFYFNTNGIAFLYNPYEVASYAQGQIIVFIPFAELKNYLVPDFARRMNIK
ncbi:DUF3298 domain-containing protein [Pedobacter sp. AW1-32]|uniref:DUF3298 domain-containing protein n=1 Tax=Pedobacter sp. AW1-32 TaxID=3383026 RepID=UPI003FEF84D2